MENEKRNQVILCSIIILLVLLVIGIACYIMMNKTDLKYDAKINQIYNSYTELHDLSNGYFFGTYDSKLEVFIDSNGKEVVKLDMGVNYTNYYKTIFGDYIFYDIKDNIFSVYSFNGLSFNMLYSINEVSYVKPIISNDSLIGFSILIDDNVYILDAYDGNKSLLDGITLIADKFVNNVYYNNSNKYIVVKNSNDLYGVIDINGNYIIKCEYNDIITIMDDNFIVKSSKNKYGIRDVSGNVLMGYKYDGIIPYKDYYVVINDEKMALFDNEYNNVTGFKMNYNDLLGFNYRDNLSVNIYDLNDNIVIVNNNLEDKFKSEYKYHNMYVINDGKIINNVNQIGFNINSVIYSYDSNYNIKFYYNDFKIRSEFKLDNVSRIDDISYYNDNSVLMKYYDDDNNKISNVYNYDGKLANEEDKVCLSNSIYYVICKKNKMIVYDYDNNELAQLKGNIKVIKDNYVIVDNAIYRIIIE